VIDALRDKPFLIAIIAGAIAQGLKVISFLIAEKRVNFRRFLQADGLPNMHSAAFSALAVAVGTKDGYNSIPFAFALCLVAIILVDTMNVKNATSRQAEAILLIMERLRGKSPADSEHLLQGLSYTPLDVFSGVVVGTVTALLIL
jgi:acid phosphatase family membrane protein YuiD